MACDADVGAESKEACVKGDVDAGARARAATRQRQASSRRMPMWDATVIDAPGRSRRGRRVAIREPIESQPGEGRSGSHANNADRRSRS